MMNTYYMQTGDADCLICDVIEARSFLSAFRKAARAAIKGRLDWREWERVGREYRAVRCRHAGLSVRVTRAYESGFRTV